jgi:hypothetical protein
MTKALAFALLLATLPTEANPGEPVTLGSGHRGLVFAQLLSEDLNRTRDTVAVACNLKPGYDITEGFDASDPDTRIILKETLTKEYRKQFDSRFWAGWLARRLYSFGEDAAFADGDLFRIEQGHIRIYPGKARSEARKTYGLAQSQNFLGAFDGKVFYWTQGQPQEIRFQSGTQTYRFKLGKRVTEPLGMAKGDPKGDLALFVVAKPGAWFHVAPRTMEWVVLNLKDAEALP